MNKSDKKKKYINKMQNSWFHDEQLKQQTSQIRLTEQIVLNRFYVYQTLEFLLNLIYSYIAVKEYFKDDPDHPMIDICLNKIILQLDIANSIFFDLERSAHNNDELNGLRKQKIYAAELFQLSLPDLSNDQKQQLSPYLEFYLENLTSYAKQQQLKLLQTQRTANFDQNFLEK